MTARIWLAVLLAVRVAGPVVTTWTCDRCGEVNGDNQVHCYRCGS